MRRWILLGAATVVVLAVWTAVFVAGTLEGWWRQPLAARGDTAAFSAAADRMIAAQSTGNLAFTLIEGGRPVHERFASIGAPVDRDTLFQVASLSKWITALGVMTLVDAGRIDLDAPVDTYLKRWKLPASAFDNRQVTVRRVLSHTAGLTDGLGYKGFEPGQPIQPLVSSLTRARDASPGPQGEVKVGQQPGAGWKYSGGGYALLQLLIEDVTGEPFADYMRRAVLDPLGMTRSTYVLSEPWPANVAEIYGPGGKKAIHYRFTATSAASLYTSAADLTRLIAAQRPGLDGAPAGRGVLKPSTLAEMRKPYARQYGADIWGLGLVLYAPNGAGDFIAGHDGNNFPAINTSARFEPASGDGIVVLETGDDLLATRLAGEWVFWRTGNVDNLMVLMEVKQTLVVLAIGWGVILLGAAITGWRLRRRRR